MSVYTNETSETVRVQYRKVGKFYHVGIGEGGEQFDDGEKTSYPFDEAILAAGESVDLGETSWQTVVSKGAADRTVFDSEKSLNDYMNANLG